MKDAGLFFLGVSLSKVLSIFDTHKLIVSRDMATSEALLSHFRSAGSANQNISPMAVFGVYVVSMYSLPLLGDIVCICDVRGEYVLSSIIYCTKTLSVDCCRVCAAIIIFL